MRGKKCKYPFKNWIRYKQILPNGRCYYHMVNKKNRKRTLISRARYRLSVKLERKLKRKEHVDHIDGDFRNDRIGNLQILSQKENNRKRVIENGIDSKLIFLVCPNCNQIFSRPPNHVKHKLDKGKTVCCSRSCATSYYHKCQ